MPLTFGGVTCTVQVQDGMGAEDDPSGESAMVRMQIGYAGGAAGMGHWAGAGMGYGMGDGFGHGPGYGAGFGPGSPGAGMGWGGSAGIAMHSQLLCDGFGMTYGLGSADARFAAGLTDVFSFTLAGDEVTAAAVTLPWGATIELPVSAGIAYSLAGDDVLATRDLAGGFSQVRYSDTDGDGLYQAIGTARVLTEAPHVNVFGVAGREALEVTIAGEQVTGVTQLLPWGLEWVRLSGSVDPDGVEWTLEDGLVVETATLANGATAWEVFRDGNADGVYTEVASGTGELVDLVGVLAATDAVATAL